LRHLGFFFRSPMQCSGEQVSAWKSNRLILE